MRHVLDTGASTMAAFLPSFCILFKHVLESNTNLASQSVLNTIISMKHLVPALESQKVKKYNVASV